jgi:hypothetical protein
MTTDSDHENDDINANWSTVEYWEGVAESVVRITAAGFAGSLIGLAKERLYETHPPPNETPFTSTTTSKVIVLEQPLKNLSPAAVSKQPVSISKKLPRRPPQVPIPPMKSASTSALANLPIVWSVSCMLFATILESCRLSSPTNSILQIIDTSSIGNSFLNEKDSDPTRTNFEHEVQRTAITSFGDYTLGGTIAGFAGVIGQRRQQYLQQGQVLTSSRIPTTRFGLATGFGLGIIAGTFQAAIDVSNLYLKEKERMEYEAQKGHDDNQPDPTTADVEVEDNQINPTTSV